MAISIEKISKLVCDPYTPYNLYAAREIYEVVSPVRKPWFYYPEVILQKSNLEIAKRVRELEDKDHKLHSEILLTTEKIEILEQLFNRRESYQKSDKRTIDLLDERKMRMKYEHYPQLPKEFSASKERSTPLNLYIRSWMPWNWRSNSFINTEMNENIGWEIIFQKEILDKLIVKRSNTILKFSYLQNALEDPTVAKTPEVQKILKKLRPKAEQAKSKSSKADTTAEDLRGMISRVEFANGKSGAPTKKWLEDKSYRRQTLRSSMEILEKEMKEKGLSFEEIAKRIQTASKKISL